MTRNFPVSLFSGFGVLAGVSLLFVGAPLASLAQELPPPPDFSRPVTPPPPAPVVEPVEGGAPFPERTIFVGGYSYAADQVLVKFKASASEAAVRDVLAANSLVQLSHAKGIRWRCLRVPGPLDAQSWVALLNRNPLVEYAEMNAIISGGATPTDAFFASEQFPLRLIGLEATWNRTRGGSFYTAVLDSGISRQHVDLLPKIAPRPNGAVVNGTNLYGFNEVTPSSYPDDDESTFNGHGSFVSGILAAATATGLIAFIGSK